MGARQLEIRLFGAFSLSWDDGEIVELRGAKHCALVVLLALAPNGVHTRAWLQELLWERSGAEHGRASLRRALSELRKAFGSEFERMFATTNTDIRLNVESIKVIGSTLDGEFLEGVKIQEPGFDAWLRAKRCAYELNLAMLPSSDQQVLAPKIAIVPFVARGGTRDEMHFSDLLAQEVARCLSRSKLVAVISHLSSRRIDGSQIDLLQVKQQLDVDYLIYGSVVIEGGKYQIDADFVGVETGIIQWTRRMEGKVQGLLSDGEQLNEFCWHVGQALLGASIELAASRPLSEIESHALLMTAVDNMHMHRLANFARSRSQLEELIRRYPEHSELQAWLGKWYVLSVSQGWSTDPVSDLSIASTHTQRGLEINPDCSLSMTIDGMARSNQSEETNSLDAQFQRAVSVDPNNALAWLMYSRLQMFDGAGELALLFAKRACELSPIDPYSYFFDIIRASAHSVCGQYDEALTFAEKSLKSNPRHTSSHRVKVIALQMMGNDAEAKGAAKTLMKMEPRLSVESYIAGHVAGDRPMTRVWAEALRSSGVPEKIT